MMFLGGFLACDTSMNPTPLAPDTMEYFEIENGIFDEVYIDGDTNRTPTTEIPEWGYSTILDAKFHGNILAGNVDFTLSSISDMLIKKRKKGSYKWTTIHKIPISTEEDFDFFYNDIVVASKTSYEYAAVPIVNGVEGTYQIIDVDVWFEGAFIIDPTHGYQVIAEFKREQLTRGIPSTIIEPVNATYAYTNYYAKKKYDSFSISGIFVELDWDSCSFDLENGWKYRKAFRDFISNQRSKIVKIYDGQMYMMNVIDQITENYDSHPEAVVTTIPLVECGDIESNKDLYYHGFINYLEVVA